MNSPACRATQRQRWTRVLVVVSVFPMLHLLSMHGAASTHHWQVKVLTRLLTPFRSHALLQTTTSPCEVGLATCFAPDSPTQPRFKLEPEPSSESLSRSVMLELRTGGGGPLAHHWLELESLEGKMTIGFGPATVKFIDAGQVSLQDRYGNIERISGMHPIPLLTLPPVSYHYARAPGEGLIIGKPIRLTLARSDALTRKLQHLKFVGPYIPIFHDCRTFACAIQSSVQGHSALPCYLLFKGYW
jgi:hypothetical protein